MTQLNLVQVSLFNLSEQETPYSLTHSIFIHVLTHTKHAAVAMIYYT